MVKPHALVVPVPAQGHINPLMHLSKLLASSGIHVSFVHSEYNLQRILQHQGTPLPHHLGFDIELLSISDGLPLHTVRAEGFNNFSEEEVSCRQRSLLASFERLMEEMTSPARPPLTCVIADYFADFAHRTTKKFGVPEIIFWPQSAAVFAIYSETQEMISKGLICPVQGIVRNEEVANYLNCTCIPGLPPLQGSSLPYMHTERWQRYLFGVIQESNKYTAEVPLILCNSFWELERETMESVVKNYPLCAVGPLLPSTSPNECRGLDYRSGASLWKEEACLEWLDTQATDSVLYVSVGSHILIPKTQMHEIAHGLKDSKQPFLWVIRGHQGEQALREMLPEGFDEETKDQGRVVAWAPQVWVLGHAAVGGFLTHCGWNSTLESVKMGVPMITWSWIVDQKVNERLVVDTWKVGVQLGQVSRAEVDRAVRRLMQDQAGHEMRVRARKLQQAATCDTISTKHSLMLFRYIRHLATQTSSA